MPPQLIDCGHGAAGYSLWSLDGSEARRSSRQLGCNLRASDKEVKVTEWRRGGGRGSPTAERSRVPDYVGSIPEQVNPFESSD